MRAETELIFSMVRGLGHAASCYSCGTEVSEEESDATVQIFLQEGNSRRIPKNSLYHFCDKCITRFMIRALGCSRKQELVAIKEALVPPERRE